MLNCACALLFVESENRDMNTMQIHGRRSSHFTRVTLMFAEELAVAYELVPIYDMKDLARARYSDNPALKLPILQRGDDRLFGTINICRGLAEAAHAYDAIVWPEDVRDTLSRNANELVWHCMSAQVQLVFGTVIGKLPADNVFFAKGRAGLEGALQWLDGNLDDALQALPASRRLSLFEVALFCLLEHLVWRETLTLDALPKLNDFVRSYGQRPSAQRTPYAFDVPPG